MSVTIAHMGVLLLLQQCGFLDSVETVCDFGAMEIDAREPVNNPVFEALFRSRRKEMPPEFYDGESRRLYAIAGDFYRRLGWRYTSYDIDGRFGSTFLDLNVDQIPPEDREKSSLTMNLGTSEHIFNQHNFFLQFHNVTRVSGLMIHSIPFHRHGDHGLYSYTPAFFFSLAHYNGYEVLGSWQSGKPEHNVYRSWSASPEGRRVLLITVMRRIRPGDFAVPLQVNEPMWPSREAEGRYGVFSRQSLDALRPAAGLPDEFYVDVPTATVHEGPAPARPVPQMPPANSHRLTSFVQALLHDPRRTVAWQIRKLPSRFVRKRRLGADSVGSDREHVLRR